jgi:hypothetical protein
MTEVVVAIAEYCKDSMIVRTDKKRAGQMKLAPWRFQKRIAAIYVSEKD